MDTELEILRNFYQSMLRLVNSGAWPETKEEALHDAVNRTAEALEHISQQ